MKFLQLLSLLLLLSLKPPIYGHSHELQSGNKIRCLDTERKALLEFKADLIDTQGRLTSWGDQEDKRDCCKWRQVYCDNHTNHVVELNLHNEDGLPLKGMISTSLLQLKQLQYLDLSYNDFGYAPIPHFISSLQELQYLNFFQASFSGQIPYQLGNLSKLLFLNLGSNYFYSESLHWLSHLHSLEFLDLSSTNLSQATDWVQMINKLTSISELNLGSCQLQDILPPSINASAPLSVLDLKSNSFEASSSSLLRWFSNFSNGGLTSIEFGYNHIQGPIPDIFANMMSLETLHLYGTGLEGGIPSYFGNMSKLLYFDLSVNNLTGDIFELTTNMSGLLEKSLQYIDFRWNGISGTLPNMSRFSSLIALGLRKNRLNGTIQDGYLKLPHLQILDLSSNQLTGPLPLDPSFISLLRIVYLDNNNFNGTLTENIGTSPQLAVLDLSSNSFLTVNLSPHWVPLFQLDYLSLRSCRLGPSFPFWLQTQKNLVYIDISSTGISGRIPSWFGGVGRNLAYLNTSNNQISGVFPTFSFPASVSNDEKVLDVSKNKISGTIKFLCSTRVWELIDLSDNLFFDQIPDCFTHFEKLKYLNLANNNLSREIPDSFGSLRNLSLLHLRNNSFSGELPTSMENCTKLIMLDVGQNQLSGKVPSSMGKKLSKLKVLILRFNHFHGTLPSSLCDLPQIQILDISSNDIHGRIPDCIHKYIAMTGEESDDNPPFIADFNITIPTTDIFLQSRSLEITYFMWKGQEVKYINHMGLVRLIDLSNNNLVGEIPIQITNLVGLVGLNLSTNRLRGYIPANIGKLKELNFLDFSRNHLSGHIPISLGEITYIGVLNLSYNNLSGRIPQSTQLMGFNESTYVGNSGLCGLPLDISCPGDALHQNSGKRATGKNDDEDGYISEGFYISLVFGFIIGFWGIFGTIFLNKTVHHAFVKVLNAAVEIFSK